MSQSRILVVEDHPVSRKLLEAMLKTRYRVISAAGGRQALSLAQETRPDLVLLDIEMPEMDGFQTLESLRGGLIDVAVPVIFLTAREDAASREQGLEAGAVDYITKPYDRQELLIKVKNHLALYEARKEIEAKNRIMAREMEMASQLQKSLLPREFPRDERIDFDVVYRPVSQAGGDFYDLVLFPDGSFAFVQVDVSGHGVASAMIGAMFKMVFHSLARDIRSPAKVLASLNESMFDVLPDSDFLTVFYGIVDPSRRELVFCNAGHTKPFLCRFSSQEIEELDQGGPLIGAFPGMVYDEGRVALGPGDKILVFTDGVTETRTAGPDQEFYGEERLRELLLRHAGLRASEIIRRIMDDLEDFSRGAFLEDDVTMMVIGVM